MYIPSTWADKVISTQVNTGGMSGAEVARCETPDGYFYLKSIDTNTAFGLKQEKDVMLWLSGRLNVPEVIDFGCENGREFLVMSELHGSHIDDFCNRPEEYVTHLANCIAQVQSVDISNCPFDSSIAARLSTLEYMLDCGFADIDTDNWEPTTAFKDPNELYHWLCNNKPVEDFVFSHGDISANFIVNNADYYFYDLSWAGIADKWLDIAFCVRDIRDRCAEYEHMFFERLNIEPNYEKIEYFILLDEMF
ncbi:MAG: aminoglycoside 3'-phosphotransferase [Oscillospiraceae bacterium]|nr:aminoglycoside 3'-phosphotransferase [Oscillospiraceae bacterium]